MTSVAHHLADTPAKIAETLASCAESGNPAEA
jgi:hypothetical protein